MSNFPEQGSLLGIDFGTKRVGIALSTPDQSIASPLETLQRSQPDAEKKLLCKICNEYRVKGIVIGLPVHMSGEEGTKAKQARTYGNWCGKVTELPVLYWDERYTSSIAEHHLRNASVKEKKIKSRLDMLAAQVMLQSFLDAPDRYAKPKALPTR